MTVGVGMLKQLFRSCCEALVWAQSPIFSFPLLELLKQASAADNNPTLNFAFTYYSRDVCLIFFKEATNPFSAVNVK